MRHDMGKYAIVPSDSLRIASTAFLKGAVSSIDKEYAVFVNSSVEVVFGTTSLERMVQVADDTSADMVYADYDGHPLIDCRKGALRDDFDFGQAVLFRTSSLRRAVESMSVDRKWGAMYELRLMMDRIVHVCEPLYRAVESDTRKSGEKQFDYVDPRNREVQVEMEQICTDALRRMGGYLAPDFAEPPAGDWNGVTAIRQGFPVVASVVIPVLNRVRTVADAIRSALGQKTDFPYNVIVVDNHSTDGTTELIESLVPESGGRLVHLVPEQTTLGIGGCWNYAIRSQYCGKYVVQ